MATFIPRAAFPTLHSLPRSYYLGHHAAGLSKMKTLLSQIDLIVECRDQRIPLTSRNPLFEESLGERERMIVYTKNDLGNTGSAEDLRVRERVQRNKRDARAHADFSRDMNSFGNTIVPRRSSFRTTRIAGTFGAYSISSRARVECAAP